RTALDDRRAEPAGRVHGVAVRFERHFGLQPVDPHEREPPGQRRALVLARHQFHGFGRQVSPVDRSGELGVGHRAISPASSFLLSSAASLPWKARRRRARASVGWFSTMVTLRPSAASSSALSGAASASRRAPSRPPSTAMSWPTFLPTTTSPTPLSRS